MISEGLSGPGGEMLRAGQTVGSNLFAPLTLTPQEESTNNIYLCHSGGSKPPIHGRTTAFWPSAASPRRVRAGLTGSVGGKAQGLLEHIFTYAAISIYPGGWYIGAQGDVGLGGYSHRNPQKRTHPTRETKPIYRHMPLL